jgi:hypothetical protein
MSRSIWTASATCADANAVPRSKLSVDIATLQPSSTSPTTLDSGIRTSS